MEDKLNAFQILEEVVEHALKDGQSYGDNATFRCGGHNGPYFDIETPIRNTAHWLTSFSILYAETGEKSFYDSANKLCNFLLSPGIYEKDGVLIQRQKAGKDWCNGVIGQAWAIEALSVAGRLLSIEQAIEYASELASAFDFSSSAGAWIKKDPQNGKRRIDYTLNHQLWFAAALSMLNSEKFDMQIRCFLDSLNNGALRLRENGLINHLLFAKTPKSWMLRFRYRFSEVRNRNAVLSKELGYHLYNLHPLARLKQRFSEHPVFRSAEVQAAIDFAFTNKFVKQLENNKYAYPYNAPGFEFPLVARTFARDISLCNLVWQRQIEKTYSAELKQFCLDCPDSLTLNARVYEWLLDIFYDKYV